MKHVKIRVPVMIAIKRFSGTEAIGLTEQYTLLGKQVKTPRYSIGKVQVNYQEKLE